MARIEIGYQDMLAARYDRAGQWLDPELVSAGDPVALARVYSYLGCMSSDRAEYDEAATFLARAMNHSRVAKSQSHEAYAASLVGRLHFLRGDLDLATELLEKAIELHDLFSFVPWPQTFLGEVALERGELESADRILQQAFARASQIGDTCWEAVSGRALGLLAAAQGEPEQAFATLQDATRRSERRTDTYVWAKAYVLDAQCSLGLAHGHEARPHGYPGSTMSGPGLECASSRPKRWRIAPRSASRMRDPQRSTSHGT